MPHGNASIKGETLAVLVGLRHPDALSVGARARLSGSAMQVWYVRGRTQAQRERFFLLGPGAAAFPLQKSATCFAASAWTNAACRFAAAVACPRAVPMTRFAELSHKLTKGFLAAKELRICFSNRPQGRALHHHGPCGPCHGVIRHRWSRPYPTFHRHRS